MKIFSIITALPQLINNNPIFKYGVIGKSVSQKKCHLKVLDLRCFYKKVDDRPYGGSPGMIIKYDPVDAALKSVLDVKSNQAILMPCISGQKLDVKFLSFLNSKKQLIFICGRYGGIDYRIEKKYQPYKFSIGDIIVSGGEIPAMLVIDAVIRLIPGTLGNSESLESGNLLSEPQYTRPKVTYDGLKVPEVLLSGNKKKIKEYNLLQSLKNTLKSNRKDLIVKNIKNE